MVDVVVIEDPQAVSCKYHHATQNDIDQLTDHKEFVLTISDQWIVKEDQYQHPTQVDRSEIGRGNG